MWRTKKMKLRSGGAQLATDASVLARAYPVG
jgi:hypothetical protein